MICAIHQPQYLPWLGYFDKMSRADVFVLLDNVQFKKNEWQNRNRIRTSNDEGWQWLTVPVCHEFGQNINEVKIKPTVDWRSQHQRAFEANYARAPYFKSFWPEIRSLYEKEWLILGDLNIASVQLLARLLGIKTRIVIASDLSVSAVRTQRLIDICRAVDCGTYLAGAGAEDYMDFDLFQASGIKMEVQQYEHPVYPQLWSSPSTPFISHLSAVDRLLNTGE